jgi:hypothetical protein
MYLSHSRNSPSPAEFLRIDLERSASTNPNLANCSVLTAPDCAADESVVAEVSAGTVTISTDSGLIAPGSTAQFKVSVVLTTGNEKGATRCR